jgi:hypothetical protein
MSKASPKKEIKLMTIEEVDFDLPEVEPPKEKAKDKKNKKTRIEYVPEESKEKPEKKTNRIKR